jgi:hypothetical protein
MSTASIVVSNVSGKPDLGSSLPGRARAMRVRTERLCGKMPSALGSLRSRRCRRVGHSIPEIRRFARSVSFNPAIESAIFMPLHDLDDLKYSHACKNGDCRSRGQNG